MNAPDQPRSFTIFGKTNDGKRFRPSDWAERLCGVMSAYQPGSGVGRHLTYSPWVMPAQQDGVKCVRVNARLYGHEPLAYRFLLTFANDNNLNVEYADTTTDTAAKLVKQDSASPPTKLAT